MFNSHRWNDSCKWILIRQLYGRLMFYKRDTCKKIRIRQCRLFRIIYNCRQISVVLGELRGSKDLPLIYKISAVQKNIETTLSKFDYDWILSVNEHVSVSLTYSNAFRLIQANVYLSLNSVRSTEQKR